MSVARLFREAAKIPEEACGFTSLIEVAACASFAVFVSEDLGAGEMLILCGDSVGADTVSFSLPAAGAVVEVPVSSGFGEDSDVVAGVEPSFATRRRRICSIVSLSGASGSAGDAC